MMRMRFSCFVVLGFALSGCFSADCPHGFVERDGQCVPAGDGGSKSACGDSCSGTTPVCDESTARCVGCLSATDCPPGANVCDQETHTCLGCNATSDCPSPTVCDPATRACVACVGNADCTNASAPFCDTTVHVCVACVGSSDCIEANKPLCDPGNHTCVGCLATSDCHDASKPICESSAHACVECLGASDCHDASKPICDTSTHACVGCLAATDCTDPAKPTCDATAHACRACGSLADCGGTASGPICDAGRCVQCTTTTEASACGANACNPTTKKCTSVPRGSLGICDACQASSQCASGFRCFTRDLFDPTTGPVCLPIRINDACPESSPIPGAFYNPSWGLTVEGPSMADCSAPATCTSFRRYHPTTPGASRWACTYNSECANPSSTQSVPAAVCATVGPQKGQCTLLCGDAAPISSFLTDPAQPCDAGDVCRESSTIAGQLECSGRLL